MGGTTGGARLKIAPWMQSNLVRPVIMHDDSGQVYTEVTCPGGPMTADWVWKTTGRLKKHGRYRFSGPGCSTLFDMAIRSALRNSISITHESLCEVPWAVGGTLWQSIIAAQLDSVNLWKSFTSAYPNELDTTLNRKHHIITQPNMRISSYVTPITSPAFHWLTFLTLSNLTCSRTDLIQLSRLTNLAALTIGPLLHAPEVGLDDSIIRSWARIAATSTAFSQLRVINARSQAYLTRNVFTQLSELPSLALFTVENCKLGSCDTPEGWRYRTGVDLADWLLKAGGASGASWDSVVHACFKLGGAFGAETLTAEGVEAVDALPVLHLSVGATPQDAALNTGAQYAMRCFYRTGRIVPVAPCAEHAVGKKRPASSDFLPAVGDPSRKKSKPVLRASKRQDLGSLLQGFST